MARDDKRIIEMTLEGEFVSPPPPKPPFGARVMLWAIVTMVLAITVLIVAVTFWFVVMILPLILGAALVAYLAFRYQLWRGGGRTFTIRRGPGGW
jgi:membrane protein YdbS with pleckstrin-like domain